jgi:hypothetical protein
MSCFFIFYLFFFTLFFTTKNINCSNKIQEQHLKSVVTPFQIIKDIDKSLNKSHINYFLNEYEIQQINTNKNNTKQNINKQVNFKINECISNLIAEDGKNWTCSIEYKKIKKIRKPMYCACSYKYECGRSKRIYLSEDYALSLKNLNKLVNINRGADLQCEQTLTAFEKKQWTCRLFRKKGIKEKSNSKNESVYCKCSFKELCKHERIVDFY